MNAHSTQQRRGRTLWARYWIVVFIAVGGAGYVALRGFVFEPFPPHASPGATSLLFDTADSGRSTYVKRVVGLPGDRISYVDHQLRINEQEVASRFVSEAGGIRRYEEQLGDQPHPVQRISFVPGRNFNGTVPARHYFVMGDNRDNSRDCRFAPDRLCTGNAARRQGRVGRVPGADAIGAIAA